MSTYTPQRYALALILASLAFHAKALTLPAWEDTTATRGQLSTKAGKAVSLTVDSKRTALLYFDLSAVPATTAAQIRYARLRIFSPKVTTAGGGLAIHVITAPWDEVSTVAEPSHEASPAATIDGLSLGTKRFASVDVTAAVKDWIGGTVANEGFAVLPGAGASLQLGSKEGTATGYPAELEVELNAEPGSVMADQLAPNLTLGGTTSGTFSGDGAALKNIATANLTGKITSDQLAPDLSLGGVTSGAFTGSGAGLTNLPAVNLTGQLTSGQLSPNLTLGGVTIGSFAGNGSNLTNLKASNIAGQIGSAQLGSDLTLAGLTTGNFAGSGAGLTGVPTTGLTGLIASAQLAQNLTLGGTTNGSFSGAMAGTFTGNGSGLQSIPAASLTGQISSAQLSSNLALAGVTTGTFAGNGSALTNLSAASLTGQLTSGQLSSNLTLGGVTSGSFAGNGSGLTNLLAANLTGQIASTQLAPGLSLAGTTSGTFSGDGAALQNLNAASVGSGSVSNSEFGFLDGATANLQNQLEEKVSKAGDTITGKLTVNGGVAINGALQSPGAGVGTTGFAFVHVTAPGNVTTQIDHPLCNNDPNAILIVTHQTLGDLNNPATLHNHPVGVAYFQGHWLIYNEDFAFMPGGMRFNVLVIKP